MFFRRVSLLMTLFLIVFFGCEYTKTVLQPVDTIVPLSSEMNQTLMQHWWVTKIDGEAITESLSQLQILITEHVSEDIKISFLDSFTNPSFQFKVDGTWKLEVNYHLDCERIPVLDEVNPIENSAVVFIRLLVGGTYIAGYDIEKQSNVLIFETDKHTDFHIHHVNPYSDFGRICIPELPTPEFPCPQPVIYPAFTEDLDWSVFEDEPLSKIFSSPLFDTQTDTPVVYTWDMVISEDTPGVGYTIRLYSQGQEDIILSRTDVVID